MSTPKSRAVVAEAMTNYARYVKKRQGEEFPRCLVAEFYMRMPSPMTLGQARVHIKYHLDMTDGECQYPKHVEENHIREQNSLWNLSKRFGCTDEILEVLEPSTA